MNDIQITKLLPSHAGDVADLHISGIHTGFISSLGIKFVTALYKAIAESKSAFGKTIIPCSNMVRKTPGSAMKSFVITAVFLRIWEKPMRR